MDLNVGDVMDWPGTGSHNIEDVLTYLDRLRRSPDAIASPVVSYTDVVSHAARPTGPGRSVIPNSVPASDPLAGRIGDVLPSLHLLVDVDLRSSWLEDLAEKTGCARAIATLRRYTDEGTTVGDLLTTETGLVPGAREANSMLGGLLLDFLAQLATHAYEVRMSAIETVSSWIASTSGRATWSEIAKLDFDQMPVEVQKAWSIMASMPIAEHAVSDAVGIVSEFIHRLNNEDRTILLDRTIAIQP